MSVIGRVVGPAIAEWNEDEPLRWAMTETVGKGKYSEIERRSFDLSRLQAGFSQVFLLALKDALIDARLKVRLQTVHSDAQRILHVLQVCLKHFEAICHECSLEPARFDRIDSDLLAGLLVARQEVAKGYLGGFKAFYTKHRHNAALYAPDLHPGDFPPDTRDLGDCGYVGSLGLFRKNVLASALSRATLVQILSITEAALEAGKLSLDLFAFSRLMLSRAARPESLRLLRLKDLKVDTANGLKAYFLTFTIPKARMAERPRAAVPIHRDIGAILERQRDAVANRLGYLVDEPYTIGDLPLFPARGNRMFRATKERLGMIRAAEIYRQYVRPLKDLTGAKIGCTVMRHTIGTQLAIAGCSANTIAAVLLHSSSDTASVYVDLVFSGAIDKLSDSLEPAFLEHFPVFKEFVSVRDLVDPAKRIVSPSADRTRRETTGQCGQREICQYAPIACYECPRFKPCYDVDHTTILERVDKEIESARGGGLPRQADLKRFMHIRNRICVVINICEVKRAAVEVEQAAVQVVS